MDTWTALVVLALVATIVTMLMGIFTMGAGGAVDDYAGTRLMWARVGLQALTLLLMVIALLIR
jgi:hypothetical protein